VVRKFSRLAAQKLDESMEKGFMFDPDLHTAMTLVGIAQELSRIADALEEMNQTRSTP
jgi:hypothetical protein